MSELVQVEQPAPPRDPLSLFAAAIDKGFDADQLDKLLTLQERYTKSRAEEEFNQALNRVQQRAPIVVKDAENKHTRSKYARLEAVNNVIKPVYTEEGFSLSFGTEASKLDGHIRVVADLRHAKGHTARYAHDLPLDGKGAKGGQISMNELQASGSTLSYGRRYLTCMIFNVTVADEDNDGMGKMVQPDQIEAINNIVEEIQSLDRISGAVPFVLRDFLAWLDVEGLDKLPQSKVSKALVELDRQRRKAKVAAQAAKKPKKDAAAQTKLDY